MNYRTYEPDLETLLNRLRSLRKMERDTRKDIRRLFPNDSKQIFAPFAKVVGDQAPLRTLGDILQDAENKYRELKPSKPSDAWNFPDKFSRP